ncbi:protein phosphatase 2C domain-containing protein [Aquincola sp. S2]|uniref:Protein phosphatase 2C domain-containing protein n=1 Tax=Pseudaquabacterium terrae TaxID=2732868 RepID=A0ABX2E9D8_9BURK|nr:protein phosphatase 2C domain-containing protein [Aquabacterium terrae]NRF65604.1 protein phosphatase 2C domain-containing protein [Aquabacterium terrae]
MPCTPITPLEPPPLRPDAVAGSDEALAHSAAWARIEFAAASTCGSAHALNEDAHSTPERAGRLFVVADGVGGGALARTASRQLVARLHRSLDVQRIDAQRIRQAVLDADRAIKRYIERRADAPGAATLVLAAPANLLASRWLVGWVGDCRAYRIGAGGGSASLLTQDDSFRHLNETPPPGSSPDDPARMVGNGATLGANVVPCELAQGELLMLCSDGVHKHVEALALGRVLGTAGGSLAQRCDALVALARSNGSADDATVLLLRHGGFALPWSRRGAKK